MLFGKPPEESFEYLRTSMIRLAILWFLLFGFLKVTEIWEGFEAHLILQGGIAIIYFYCVYFIKRKRENRKKQSEKRSA